MLALGLARIFPSWSRIRQVLLVLVMMFIGTCIMVTVLTLELCRAPGRPIQDSTLDSCRRGARGIFIDGVIAGTGEFFTCILGFVHIICMFNPHFHS